MISKKVLHVITNFSALGGAEMMLQKLILAQPQYDHYIISLIEISDIYKDSLSKAKYFKALGWNIKNTYKVISELKNKIIELEPDIIQSWMYHANFMTTIAHSFVEIKIPIYWGIHHSLNSISEESLSTKIAIYLNKFLSKNVTGIIYCAQSSLKQHKEFGFKNNNQVFIPNGVNLNDFKFTHRNFELPVIVGFVGRLHKAKGIPYLFKVMSKFRNNSQVIFKVAGHGLSLDNQEIRDLFEKNELGENVKLLGPVREMENFYQNIDVLLMTSITEGFPNVLIEAMATGAVCISTDVGDASNIIGLKNHIVPISDINSLVSILEKYIYDEKVNKVKLALNCNSIVLENYSLLSVQKKYSDIWESNL